MGDNNSVVYSSFAEFYKYYLSEHNNVVNRTLHVIGVLGSAVTLLVLLVQHEWYAAPFSVFIGYALGWPGHFFFEKNRPASFKYPLYSFIGDIVMTMDVIIGRESLRSDAVADSQDSRDRG